MQKSVAKEVVWGKAGLQSNYVYFVANIEIKYIKSKAIHSPAFPKLSDIPLCKTTFLHFFVWSNKGGAPVLTFKNGDDPNPCHS